MFKPKEVILMMIAVAIATFASSMLTTYVTVGNLMADWVISLLIIAVIVLWLQSKLKKAV